MNKRQREILAALQPATDFAMKVTPKSKPEGFAFHNRISADAGAELMIYGTIGGGGFFDDGITAQVVAAALREAGPGPINVRINSNGGDVFQGVAIHTLLARHAGTVTVYVDGIAASAASFIMLAGDRIVAARNAFVMIHDAMTGTYGNGDTHRQAGELLDKVSVNIADMYAERAGEDVEHWRAAMTVNGEDGTWYTGQEALKSGLVDELTETKDDEDAAHLAVWENVLPPAGKAFLEAHPEVDDSGPDLTEKFEQHAAEDHTLEADSDYAYAMSMWAWRNTGRTAANKENA